MQGRGKKDAKQVSASAVLEMLLVNVPESDFLMPGKAKQTKSVQPTPRSAVYGRGRGRIRPNGGRYMSQRNTADYVDSSPYNEAPYNYGVDGFSTPGGGYNAGTPGSGYSAGTPGSGYTAGTPGSGYNAGTPGGGYNAGTPGGGYSAGNAGFGGVTTVPQAFNHQQQQQQQPQQGFGMNLGGMNTNLVASGPLGHVGDARGMPGPFQQVCCVVQLCVTNYIWSLA